MTETKRFELIPMCNKNDIWYGVFDNLEKEYVTDKLCEDSKKVCDKLNNLSDENEQLKSENKRLKRLTTRYHVINIEKVLPAIAECKGITVEEYLEEIEEEYTKEGDLK